MYYERICLQYFMKDKQTKKPIAINKKLLKKIKKEQNDVQNF